MTLQVFTRGAQLDREQMKCNRNQCWILTPWQHKDTVAKRGLVVPENRGFILELPLSLFDTCWLGHLRIARKIF